jgi:alkaline phosphatase
MSVGVPSMAEPFSRLVRSRGTNWYQVACDPLTVHGSFEMHSLNSYVTDSAAASTAWATGSRVVNGSINTLPDGTKLTNIGQLAHSAGKRVGLVTTTRITHATPAGFAAVQQSRDEEHDIARQYLNQVDVLMGGGIEFFDKGLRQDKHDLINDFTSNGYTFWNHRSQLSNSKPNRQILGLFGKDHLPYKIDQQNDADIDQTVPTLAEMTKAALDTLETSSQGFLLQIEGGRVDHAAHKNDAAALLWEQLDFDDAIGVVMSFVEKQTDTLVIFTTDHGNGNPGLNGVGGRYSQTNEAFARLASANASFGAIRTRLLEARHGDHVCPVATHDILKATTGVSVTKAQAQLVAETVMDSPKHKEVALPLGFVSALGAVLGQYTGVGWSGTDHTADLVVSMARGPGSKQFLGLLRNEQVFRRLTRLMEVEHQNPRFSAEQMKDWLAAQKS